MLGRRARFQSCCSIGTWVFAAKIWGLMPRQCTYHARDVEHMVMAIASCLGLILLEVCTEGFQVCGRVSLRISFDFLNRDRIAEHFRYIHDALYQGGRSCGGIHHREYCLDLPPAQRLVVLL